MMDRLTKKDGANRNFVDVKRFDDDEWIISEMADGVTIKFSSRAVDKLAEFEDFMEKYNVESMEDLELRLEDVEHYAYNCNVEQIDEIIKLKQENQALKDRWQKLKEYAEKHFEEEPSSLAVAFRKILVRMQELEKESK